MAADAVPHTPHTPRSLRTSLAMRCAAVMLIVGMVAAAALLWALNHHNQQLAQQGQQAIARSVAQTLASQTARAIRLGIPLQKLQGVETYLQQTMDSTPQLAYLALTDTKGQPLQAVSRGKALPLIKLPVVVRGQTVAMIHAGAASTKTQGLLMPALVCMGAVLLMAFMTGWCIHAWPASRLQRRHELLLSALNQGQTLPVQEGQASDALQAALLALAMRQQRNLQAQQAVADYAAELHAVDFDQKMRQSIDEIAQTAIKNGAIQ